MKPMLSYLVCAAPRSASALLCHELDRTGLAGRPQEYFETLRRSGVPRRPHEYFDPDRHPNIVERLAFREMREDAPEPNALWRPDIYDQYLARALREGTTANGVFGAKVMWDYLMRQLTAHDASWDAYFLGFGYEPLKVTYEELAESADAVVRSVLDHLGIAAPADLQIGAPRLSVQADEVSEAWVARVLEHPQALEAPEPV
jgi:LPS sulfotransferase NodH